jgi:predicted Zn-dependent peptidase
MFVGKEIPLNQHIICSYNNYIVGFLNNIDAQNYQELINENTPKEVIEFYKKAAENENATLVFYEIGK